nr:MAG TPA: hypothetical protein [Caudoviricetes sp.]
MENYIIQIIKIGTIKRGMKETMVQNMKLTVLFSQC